MSDIDTLRAELRALAAAPPPATDRSTAVRRRIQRTRARRLAIASAMAVCTIMIGAAVLVGQGDSDVNDARSVEPGADGTSANASDDCPTVTISPAGSVPASSCTPLVAETRDGITLSIGILRGAPVSGGVTVTHVVSVHGDGKPVCGSTLSLTSPGIPSFGSYMSYCGTDDDTTFTVTPLRTYQTGEQVELTASFSRTPDGTIPPTQTGVPQAPVLLTATARFIA